MTGVFVKSSAFVSTAIAAPAGMSDLRVRIRATRLFMLAAARAALSGAQRGHVTCDRTGITVHWRREAGATGR